MKKTPYIIVNLEDLQHHTDVEDTLFFDTETCGLYQKVRLAQFYQEGLAAVLIVAWPDEFNLAVALSSYHSIMHNSHYDLTTIQQQTNTRWRHKNYDDTFLLARLAFPLAEKFNLDAIMSLVLKCDPYAAQGLDKKVLQKSKWNSRTLTEDQYAYAATDVYYMPQVWEATKSKIDEVSYKLNIHTINHCLDFQWNGMPILEDELNAMYSENEIEILKIPMPINVNSWQQVRPYIGEDESDDLALATYASKGNEKAANVRKVRKLKKQNSTIQKYLDNSVDGVIYGKFKPSTRSGRLSSDDDNLQQIPRALKKCFGAPFMVFADYAQLELRTICAITNCKLMAEKFYAGEDLHNFTAEMIFGKGFTANERVVTKTANFNFLYGGGVLMFLSILLKQTGIVFTEAEGTALRRKWRNLWPEIYSWQRKGIRDFNAKRIWATPLGMQYVGARMTDHLNIQNQGAGAEVAKLALHYMMPKIKELPTTKLRNFIHDSYILTADTLDEAKDAAKILADCMQEAWTEMSKLFRIKDLPMPVNVRIGSNWGHMEKGDFIWELDQ